MDAKRWMVFAVIVIAVIGGMVYMSTQNRLDIDGISNKQITRFIGPEDRNGEIGDRILGNKDAKVILVEYGDYQCPGCRTASPRAIEAIKKFEDHTALVFRNFPITQLHPNARVAAAAAEAAGLQDKFWEMHSLIYENQEEWSSAEIANRTDIFIGYAKQLGLDTDKFKSDISSSKITKKIDFDVAIGRKNGVTGTPAFFINGKQIEMGSETALEDAIKKALNESGVKLEEK